MIDFYMATTPNNQKVGILMEELGIKYKIHRIDLKANEQKTPQFLAMNPNGRTPVIVDREGSFGKDQTIFESAAILYYLAEKSGGKYLGAHLPEKTKVMEWVMFQMSAIGPNFGNYHYGKRMDPVVPQFVARFEKECRRLLEVLEIQLRDHVYLAGETYTIADMVTYPWVASFMDKEPEFLETTPAVRRWVQEIAKRPAVKKAMEL